MQIWVLYLHRNGQIRDHRGNFLYKSRPPLCVWGRKVRKANFMFPLEALFPGFATVHLNKVSLFTDPRMRAPVGIGLVAGNFSDKTKTKTAYMGNMRKQSRTISNLVDL